MAKELTHEDIVSLVKCLERSISESDLDSIVMINDTLTLLIKEGGFSKEFVSQNKGMVEKLCILIDESKSKIGSLREDLIDLQKGLAKKKKVSKKYTDVGRL